MTLLVGLKLFSMLIFMTVFVAAVAWAMLMPSAHLDVARTLPLEDDDG